MTLNLVRRATKGSPLSATDHDGNLDKIETAVEGKAATDHTHSLSEITDASTGGSVYAGALDSHLGTGWRDGGGGGGGDVSSVNGKTGTVVLDNEDVGAAAAAHDHAMSDITGLSAALDGKAFTSHEHAISDVTGLSTALSDLSGDISAEASAREAAIAAIDIPELAPSYDIPTRVLTIADGATVTLPLAVTYKPDLDPVVEGSAGLMTAREKGFVEGRAYPLPDDYDFFSSPRLTGIGPWLINGATVNPLNTPPGGEFGVVFAFGRSENNRRLEYYEMGASGSSRVWRATKSSSVAENGGWGPGWVPLDGYADAASHLTAFTSLAQYEDGNPLKSLLIQNVDMATAEGLAGAIDGLQLDFSSKLSISFELDDETVVDPEALEAYTPIFYSKDQNAAVLIGGAAASPATVEQFGAAEPGLLYPTAEVFWDYFRTKDAVVTSGQCQIDAALGASWRLVLPATNTTLLNIQNLIPGCPVEIVVLNFSGGTRTLLLDSNLFTDVEWSDENDETVPIPAGRCRVLSIASVDFAPSGAPDYGQEVAIGPLRYAV